jgi:NAD(P)H-flavin reductase
MEKSKRRWEGRTGFIDQQMLSESMDDLKSATCYLAGPPAMVSAVAQTLAALGISEDNIRAEEFAGY